MKLRNAAPAQPGAPVPGTDTADLVLKNERRGKMAAKRIDRRVRNRADRGCRRLLNHPAQELARRSRHKTVPACLLVASQEDEAVAFSLAPHRGRLFVECERSRGKRRAVVTMQFADAPSFLQWCEHDRLQFSYPLLYAKLKRSGSELVATS